MSCDGKLVNAYIKNPNSESFYVGFEIITCREISDYEGGTIIEEVRNAEEYLNADEAALDDPFYRVFGIFDLTRKRAIADFFDPKEAAKFLNELTGRKVNLYSV